MGDLDRWAPFVAPATTLLAVVVGFLLGVLHDQRKWRREERQRRDALRLDAYGAFVEACFEAGWAAAYSDGDLAARRTREVALVRGLVRVQLVASPRVWQAADKLYRATCDVVSPRHAAAVARTPGLVGTNIGYHTARFHLAVKRELGLK